MNELQKLLENAGIVNEGRYEDTSLIRGDGRAEFGQPGWSRDDQARHDKAEQILAQLGDTLYPREIEKLTKLVKGKGSQSEYDHQETDEMIKMLYRFTDQAV